MKIFSVFLMIVILINSIVPVYSSDGIEDYKTVVDEFIIKHGFDLFGRKGEDLYFTLREYYVENNSNSKLVSIGKTIEFDLKALGIQKGLTLKALDDNKEIYLVLTLIIFTFTSAGVKFKISKPKPELPTQIEMLKELLK